jgi:hypothetical protein
MERTAMCHCGQLKVIASGEPELVGICHCRACQRRTGSAVPTNAFYLRSAVRIEGKSKRYERAADSGRNIRCYFCPDCGSTLYWEPAIYPTIFGVAVGAFADPDFPPPTFSIWEEAMHPWMDGANRHRALSAGPPSRYLILLYQSQNEAEDHKCDRDGKRIKMRISKSVAGGAHIDDATPAATSARAIGRSSCARSATWTRGAPSISSCSRGLSEPRPPCRSLLASGSP